MTRWGCLAVAALTTGCVPVGAFQCTEDTECGDDRYCEPSGYCSITDPSCPSRRRYTKYAPESLAERCVESEPTEPSSTNAGDSAASSGESSTSSTSSGGDESTEGSSGETGPLPSPCVPAGRIDRVPLLLYDFCEGAGMSVQSITDGKLELAFENGTIGDGFEWLEAGLYVAGEATALRSIEPIGAVFDPCKRSNAVTLEAWVTPGDASQGGPTRIVSIANPEQGSGVNLELNQNPDWDVTGFVAVLRTSSDGSDGREMQVPLETVIAPMHLVLVHDPATDLDHLWVDGTSVAMQEHPGELGVWNGDYDLVLANQPNYDVRNWHGTYHLIAFYCEALEPAEIEQNFAAGPRAD